MNLLYLWINLGTLSIPFLLSFNKTGHFYKRWKPLFISIIILFFCVLSWDIWFAYQKIWGFNSDFLIGIDIFHLPIEEWLFFICVPYAFMFLYDQLVVLKAPNYLQKIEYILDYMMIGIATLFLIIGYPKLYTCTVSILVILTTSLAVFLKAPNKGIFYTSYVIILMPFTLVNGVLTGYFTDNPIVWYNNAENLGIRFLTIPIEDFLYYFLMYEICYLSYEQIKKAIFKMA